MGFGPQKTHFGPLWTPQKSPFEPILHTKWPKWDSKTAKKKRFLGFFLLKIILFRFPDGLGHSKTQNWPPRPPVGPHFVGILAQFGVKKTTFSSKMYFYTKRHFRGPHITFHWVLSGFGTSKNDKMYTLGPAERPSGSERVPEEPKMAPRTLLGPFGPISVYFSGHRPEIFLSPFGPK